MMADITVDISDSDDDLLGLKLIPKIPTKSIKHVKRASIHGENDLYGPNHGNGGGCTQINSLSFNIPDSLMRKSITLQNRYQRVHEIPNIKGFIVNIHDAINFDIDLQITPELHSIYKDVISNHYMYRDIESITHLKDDIKLNSRVGKTYRCRLRGIGLNPHSESIQIAKARALGLEIRQLIDRSDGWVSCTLSNIDIYQRLLIDIVSHTGSGDIDLKDYLLTKMSTESHPIYYSYPRKRK